MVGKVKSTLAIAQRRGFFWEYPDSRPLQKIIDDLNQEKVQKAATRHVHALTTLLEGDCTAFGIRMMHALRLDSLEKIWQYRAYLMQKFDIALPQNNPVPVFLESSSAEEYMHMQLARSLEKGMPKGYRIVGVVVGDYTNTH